MSKTIKTLLTVTLALFVTGTSYAQAIHSASDEKTGTFLFVPGNDMFFLKGNETELKRLYTLLDEYRTEITAGRLPVRVDGYCASLPTVKENLRTAFVRANRVKSELITYKGMKEADFITTNCACSYHNNKDVVVVTLRIPVKKEKKQPETVQEKPKREEPKVVAEPDQVVVKDSQPLSQKTVQQTCRPAEAGLLSSESRYVAVKTNLAAWAGTIMNVAADVQVSKHVSVELPLLWCPWHITDRHAVKTFILQPEARWWLTRPGTGHFFGLHAHVGWFNVLWDKDRYQNSGRPLLGAGLSYGYLLPFGGHWAGEFTLGAGYANMHYDTFYNIDNGARIDTRSKNYWGITRVGLSVVYRF